MNTEQAKPWWYLSFANETFLGGAVVQADDLVDAAKEAHRQGCNPGGEVLGAPVPEHLTPKEGYRNRLLAKSEIDECWDDCVRLGDVRDQYDIPPDASICERQNVALDTSCGEVKP